MNKIKLACFSLVLTAGVANAAVPCNGFEIKIKNKTHDDLLVSKIELAGAKLQPNGIEKLNAGTTQVFTVNNSSDGIPMNGVLEFHSISLPSKAVSIKFDLRNKSIMCFHDDKGSGGDYSVEKTRLPNHVKYTIS